MWFIIYPSLYIKNSDQNNFSKRYCILDVCFIFFILLDSYATFFDKLAILNLNKKV
ncbi:hypothetical protein DJ59_4149 [Yersinia enterocolitica]|nr:hypothetical protein DJ59_4149 [Yersinia enterocolitica]